MNTQQAKNIQITDYLERLGINPKRIKSDDYWYCSPLRQESTPSFKVNNRLNIWYDFGLGKGGNIIDLVMLLHNLNDVSAVLKHLSKDNFSISPVKKDDSSSFQQQKEPLITNIRILPINNPALIKYINNRRISLDIVRLYCKEIHYSIGGRKYFAVGFKNDSGSYELSNPNFKGSTPPKDITTISKNNDSCFVFEGFWDFLSYLELKNLKSAKQDIIVLNSVVNLPKALEFIKQHNEVYSFMDNDPAGRKAKEDIRLVRKKHFDQSKLYEKFKDLNEYLCNIKPIQKQAKGRRM
mgnify:CR=1 FL=1